MKKTFPLSSPGKDDARVRDKIRHEVNKAVRRLRKRELPEGAGEWELACRVGTTETTAETRLLSEVAALVDTIAATGSATIFIEITAIPLPSRKMR